MLKPYTVLYQVRDQYIMGSLCTQPTGDKSHPLLKGNYSGHIRARQGITSPLSGQEVIIFLNIEVSIHPQPAYHGELGGSSVAY